MFERNTVFVLGAGASFELGFPLGTALRDKIRDFVHLQDTGLGLDGPIKDLLQYTAKRAGTDGREYVQASRRLREGLLYFNSIDDFLHHRKDDPVVIQVGKLAVAQIILNLEANSRLKGVNKFQRLDAAGLQDTWTFKLVKMLVRDMPRASSEKLFQNVTFITFNYDRSLEQFLCHAIAEACDIDLDKAVSIVSEAAIHHVYGSLGELPGFRRGRATGYGQEAGAEFVAQISEGIRTYTESIADKPEARAIRDAIVSAEQLVFLGCGFHKQNIELLHPSPLLDNCDVVATAFGMKETALDTIANRIRSLFDESDASLSLSMLPNIKAGIHRLTCTELFDEYALTLTD